MHAAVLFALLLVVEGFAAPGAPGAPDAPGPSAAPEADDAKAANDAHDWRRDQIWFDGRAEWALYDAVRTIYGEPRRYEATIFTVAQHMDPERHVKTDDHEAPGAVPVFKLVISEIIPTDRYDYRFLRTAFARQADLSPFSLVVSTQEDCGASFRRFTIGDGTLRTRSFSYFPGSGDEEDALPVPKSLVFHDALPLSLRDHPFGPGLPNDPIQIMLIPAQVDPKPTALRPARATVTFEARETLELEIGATDADRLLVRHEAIGGTGETRIWIASDPALRRIMVRYSGPWGTEFQLRRLGRWAYWTDAPPPEK